MGKKQKDVLDKMKSKFIDGATEKGFPKPRLEKIWTDWEAFASYAFNKSHSTCYAFVAFQTGYLKANYTAEFMASVLTHSRSNIDKITFFMEECKRSGLKVLGPDVNESGLYFTVNQKGEIRFGLGAVKGVGENAVESIVEERKVNGPYQNIFDMVKRVNLKAVNKKTLEILALSGALDGFANMHRAQYFVPEPNSEVTFLERIVRWGNSFQQSKDASQVSLFGDVAEVDIPQPYIPPCEPWHRMLQLSKEKMVTGFYISGHPLDDFKFELNHFTGGANLGTFKDMKSLVNRPQISIGAVVTNVNHRTTKNRKSFRHIYRGRLPRFF